MPLSEIRDIAYTVVAIAAMFGGVGTIGTLWWKAFRWADARVEREKQVTEVLARFPELVVELTKVGAALLVLSQEFHDYVAAAAARDEVTAAAERVVKAAQHAT